MIEVNDLIKLDVKKEDIIVAISKATDNVFLDNLRKRTRVVQLDCKIRGYIGEIALLNWFKENEIYIETTNQLIKSDSMDIDFLLIDKNKKLKIELKTSLVPDNWKNLEKCLQIGDIKIIKRSSEIQHIKSDIHIQIYYNLLRKNRENSLIEIKDLTGDIDNLYLQLNCSKYIDETFFVGWIDKDTLVDNINKKPVSQRTWAFQNSQRVFWHCSLMYDAKKPKEIISYLKN